MGSSNALPSLEELSLDNLNSLEKICYGRPMKESFSNVRILKIETCHSLKNLFSLSWARCILGLEEIGITDCKILEVIVAEESEGDGDHKDEVLEWSQLRTMSLERLPQLTSICSKVNGASTSQTKLNDAKSNIEIASENELETPMPAFNKKIVFPNLEDLKLSTLQVEKIWSDQSVDLSSCFHKLTNLTVKGCGKLKYLFTSVVKSLARLKMLEICDCDLMEEIIVTEGAVASEVVFPKLDYLKLNGLPNLIRFCTSNLMECPFLKKLQIENCHALETFVSNSVTANRKSTLFDENIAFSNLESMELSSIKLEKLWHDQSCVKRLTSLTVEGCGNLRYLFTSSMVESLAQLQELKIYDCKHMEEIIVTEHLGEGENGSEIVFPFPKLSSLELKGLPKLIRFCICNLIKCPSLEVLEIEKCPVLKTFVSDSVSAEVGTSTSEPKRASSTLFDDKVAFPNLERLKLSYMDGLEVIWHHELHSDSFCMLEELKVEQGKKLLNIFPPKILTRFENLESLDVTDCASLEEVFDLQSLINEKEAHDVTATELRKMYLRKLPSLKHVWKGNPQRILSFQNLVVVEAWECPGLKSLFPSSIAMDLLQLEVLAIRECGIEEIVSKEEGVEAVPRFEFPRVTSLVLFDLPELRRFYPEMHISEWPVLKVLVVYHCDKMTVFDSEIQNLQGPFKEDEIEIQARQPLFSIEKITPNLEEFALSSKDTTMIWEGQFPADFFHELKVLGLQCFHDESEDFPFGLLQRFQNMEQLVVRDGHFKQLFPDGLAFEEEHARALARTRHLTLDHLPNLEHIWSQHFQVDQFLPDLETLEVLRCSSLIYLAKATVSFQNLKVLDIYRCKALIYLVTSSTAKLLVQLRKMKVRECDMVTEVVSIEQEEAENEIIIFKKLESLTLDSLPSLTSFCSANFTFKFPSLAEVIVIQCPKMKIFSRGVLSTPELERVWLTGVKDKRRWKGNLNSTIEQLYTEVNTQDSEEE